MPKKYPDDTVYMKIEGKYVAIGKCYDRDIMSYGNYFVYNTKYKSGMNWISASPDPNFIGLETAIEESRENLREELRNILDNYKSEYLADYYTVDNIIQAIRKTFLNKKRQMLETIHD